MEDSGDHRLSRESTIMGPAGLTAVFGMGTGVTPPVWSPEKRSGGGQAARAAGCQVQWLVTTRKTHTAPVGKWDSRERTSRVRIGEPDHAPPAESRSGWSSCLAVRTGRLRRSPAVHARPIDLVVFQEPTHDCWKPHLGGGFALRCLQRLSSPDLATRRCPEQDSRHTRGRSSPILSY